MAPTLVPQQLYAVFSDASVSNISLTSSRMEILQPSQEFPIPLSCDNPLQCGIPPQQNGFSEIYIPNEGNSSLIHLKVEGENLYTNEITIPCVFNDFALEPNVRDYPLLIACVLTENNNRIRYILSNQYGNVTRSGIELVPLQQAVVSPIILTPPNNDEESNASSMWVVSINTQNEVAVFRVEDLELDIYPLPLDQPCVPMRMQKLQLDFIFLLICEDGQLHLVNVSGRISFVSLPTLITALSHNARYSLVVTLVNSTATMTFQEVLSSQSTAFTRIESFNAMMIHSADFGPDDKFAYVAIDRGIVFIDVIMALEGVEQFTHMVNIQVCSQCPPVVFLTGTIALVSSNTAGSNQLLQFFDLTSWPPLNSINRTLSGQPKYYWYDDQYIQPTPTSIPAISTTHTTISLPSSPLSSISFTGSAANTRQHDELSGGAIVGIVVGAFLLACLLIVVVVVVVVTVIIMRWMNTVKVTYDKVTNDTVIDGPTEYNEPTPTHE